ncbi:alpha/beta hydrolase [Pseudanabaena yagii]|uniref:Alpha/beta hydrolase n=1 Tax=Pseudanabaena yagii GIHE-NHR1 TaxID=2722753 RepID=A0ABX1LUK3_9CYAN|nr:alpha/beta hydrolase [Pseudanabaena yagii]NMF58469.1 alpha/beta hydrolase [Pseudanabaena yagii GIHE-NHR1]
MIKYKFDAKDMYKDISFTTSIPKQKMSNKVTQEFEIHDKSTKLVIILHAYTSSPSKMIHVRDAVVEAIPNADIFIPQLPASISSLASPIEIVISLLNIVDQLWERRQQRDDKNPYDGVIIIGHSLGAILARKIYIYACGETREHLFEPEVIEVIEKGRRIWASKVERIILLAGMNRGWKISHHMPLSHVIMWTFGIVIGNIILLASKNCPLIFNIKRGSPFLTNLRIQWLAMKQATNLKEESTTLVIQLLGSVDDIVSPDDNVDLISGEDFYYLDVPMSGHADVINIDDRTNAGQERKKVFDIALTAPLTELQQYSTLPQDRHEITSFVKRPDVQNVVFVVHGIRDLGYWTRKIARRIQKMGKSQNITIESETSTYGYFPLLSFLLPWKRREKVAWLMDQYTEALAIYPNAEFSFVGHSHGTYLLAKALQDYPSCRFKNVVFAGSVVRTDYNWYQHIEKGQVKSVLNYVATGDFVVAIFPKAFQILGLQDLGSAGHDGFNHNKSVVNVKFVNGDHGAALNELNWDAIAAFIVDDNPNLTPNEIIRGGRSPLVILLGKVAPLLWFLILIVLILIGYFILFNTYLAEWQKTATFLLYLWSVFKILTSF